jgi:hypothetical protein
LKSGLVTASVCVHVGAVKQGAAVTVKGDGVASGRVILRGSGLMVENSVVVEIDRLIVVKTNTFALPVFPHALFALLNRRYEIR